MKAMLIVDIPDEIYNELINKEYMVDIMTRRYERVYFNNRVKLKPMSRKKIHIPKFNIFNLTEEDKEIMIENRGYNTCVDELLGETE